MARSGRKASGCCCGQPAVEVHRLLRGLQGLRPPAHFGKPGAQVGEAGGQVGEEGVGVLGGQAAVEVHRLLRGLQGLRPPAHFGKPVAQVGEAGGQVWEEGVGVLGGQAAVEVHRLLRGLQGLRPPAHFGKHGAQVGEAYGQVGEEGVGVLGGQAAVEVHRLLRGLQGLRPPAQGGEGQAPHPQRPRSFGLVDRPLDPTAIRHLLKGPQEHGAIRGWERPAPRPKPGRGHLLRKDLNRLLQPAGRRLQRSPRRLRSAGDGRSAEPGQHLPDHTTGQIQIINPPSCSGEGASPRSHPSTRRRIAREAFSISSGAGRMDSTRRPRSAPKRASATSARGSGEMGGRRHASPTPGKRTFRRSASQEGSSRSPRAVRFRKGK
jgi:hypothetical protein